MTDTRPRPSLPVVQKGTETPIAESDSTLLWSAPLPRSYVNFLGLKLLRFISTLQGLGAFLLITLGVLVNNFRVARPVMRPLMLEHLARSGLFLLPMASFLALAIALPEENEGDDEKEKGCVEHESFGILNEWREIISRVTAKRT